MSKKKKKKVHDSNDLSQYKGELNAAEVSAGMNAAIRNAKRLYKSASILFDNGDYASAVSLAILAIEESGKTSVLRAIALTTDEKLLKDYWKEYHSHVEKTKLWNIQDYIPKDKAKVKLEDFKGMFLVDNMSSKHLDQVKQIGFYTDCLGNAHWSIPEEVINKDFAQGILQIAYIHCQINKTITLKEIELWIECLSPVWMKSLDEMKQGLLIWRAKMGEAGLVDNSDNFVDFVTTGMNLGSRL